MKKVFIISALALSIFALSWCNKTSNSSIPDYMSWNYNAQYHHLDLRAKWLSQMPDICWDIKDQKMLDDIRAIDMWDNQITSINSDYKCLANLQELNLSYNQISKIQNLDNLSFLSKLELQKNKLTKTDWLEKLSTLQELNLWYNEISDIKSLFALTNLRDLQLQHNQISDISSMSNLFNLESLKLEYNQISDEKSLTTISNLKNLKRISLWWNKLPEDKVKALQDKVNPAQ